MQPGHKGKPPGLGQRHRCDDTPHRSHNADPFQDTSLERIAAWYMVQDVWTPLSFVFMLVQRRLQLHDGWEGPYYDAWAWEVIRDVVRMYWARSILLISCSVLDFVARFHSKIL